MKIKGIELLCHKGGTFTVNKEVLKKFGLTDTQVDQVWGGLNGNFVTKARFDEVNSERNNLREKLKSYEQTKPQTGIGADDPTGAADVLKQQLGELQSAFQQKEKEHAAEIAKIKREALDERLLMQANTVNLTAAKPFLPPIDDGVDDKGYLELRKKHIKALVEDAETKFLFRSAEGNTSNLVGLRVSGYSPGEGNTRLARERNPFAHETYNEAEQVKLYRENPALARQMMTQAGIKLP